jgi:hypothetical protein
MARGYRDDDAPDSTVDLDKVFDRYDPDDFRRTGQRGKRAPDDGVRICNVEVVRVTDDAILFRGKGLSSDPFGLDDSNDEQWIPRSQIHESSPIAADCGPNERGDLVVTTWIAKKKGIKPDNLR